LGLKLKERIYIKMTKNSLLVEKCMK